MKKVTYLFAVVLLLVTAWSISLYRDNRLHQRYMSEHLLSDYTNLFNHVLINNAIYEEILESKSINQLDMPTLIENNSQIALILQKYTGLATVYFKRTNDDIKISKIPMDISNYFSGLSSAEAGEVVELTTEDIEKIQLINELNNIWIDIFSDIDGVNVDEQYSLFKKGKGVDSRTFTARYDTYAFKDNFWVKLLVDLSEATTEFMEYNNLVSPFNFNWLQ